jgi:hypothetical protein
MRQTKKKRVFDTDSGIKLANSCKHGEERKKKHRKKEREEETK